MRDLVLPPGMEVACCRCHRAKSECQCVEGPLESWTDEMVTAFEQRQEPTREELRLQHAPHGRPDDHPRR